METIIKLTRLRTPDLKFNDRTIGRLIVDGKKFCNTLEDVERFPVVWKSLAELAGIKVYGKTAIPTGKYELTVTYSARFKRPLVLLMNVPNYEAIRVHSGNGPENTEGCILVGKWNNATKTVYGGKTLSIEKKFTDYVSAKLKVGKVYLIVE